MQGKFLYLIACLGLGAIVLLQGCVPLVAAGAGAAAAAGTIAYTEGDLDTTYAANFNRTWNAAVAALRDSQASVVDTDKGGVKGKITARQEDGKPITVSLEQAGPNTTNVKIRVGTFGDEEVSRAINRRIASRLGTTTG